MTDGSAGETVRRENRSLSNLFLSHLFSVSPAPLFPGCRLGYAKLSLKDLHGLFIFEVGHERNTGFSFGFAIGGEDVRTGNFRK
uniref:Uncharacterized protein n=1 Tax=Candidatus Kentrum eta TaxID=2126337 RepID=A0A450VGN3_9GAMM|nr:MAG: hypothetical protein BECKH772B_GA0070898_103601 [Candidatus Kentron sp. H]VFK03966.1 MAG: hypothetical protein BECKH772A_GA0070896_103701 [Candidatus Kentron sp. H]VFK06651.1 MAG: hypothetical protein BECKH772C_GA0070978_103651 [Candidatus Kentron sp. H]